MTKREEIFYAGAKLFAEHSFNSVGIRDIAREADVNSAMISYYFGSKSGLLREIFNAFSERLISVIEFPMAKAKDHPELVELNVDALLKDARENRDIYLVGLRELNHESEELQDMRERLYNISWEHFTDFLARTGVNLSQAEDTRYITFTAVLGTIFSDYLLGGSQYIDNDEKVESYKEVVKALLKSGTPSLWVQA